jgi:hypothetical protein
VFYVLTRLEEKIEVRKGEREIIRNSFSTVLLSPNLEKDIGFLHGSVRYSVGTPLMPDVVFPMILRNFFQARTPYSHLCLSNPFFFNLG